MGKAPGGAHAPSRKFQRCGIRSGAGWWLGEAEGDRAMCPRRDASRPPSEGHKFARGDPRARGAPAAGAPGRPSRLRRDSAPSSCSNFRKRELREPCGCTYRRAGRPYPGSAPWRLSKNRQKPRATGLPGLRGVRPHRISYFHHPTGPGSSQETDRHPILRLVAARPPGGRAGRWAILEEAPEEWRKFLNSRFALRVLAAALLIIGSSPHFASALVPLAPPADLVLDYVSTLHGNINPCT